MEENELPRSSGSAQVGSLLFGISSQTHGAVRTRSASVRGCPDFLGLVAAYKRSSDSSTRALKAYALDCGKIATKVNS